VTVDEDRVRETERTTIEDVRKRDGGVEMPAPSYADDTGTNDLGADEPAVGPDRPTARPELSVYPAPSRPAV
jgi:hypothetical protein